MAQQQPSTDLYMFEGLALNPAYAGTRVQISTTLIHRNQWVNFPGAPVTQFFSSHSSFMKNKIGVGMTITRDKIGIHDDLSIYGSFAYKILSKAGNLSMGIQGGVNSISSDFNLLNTKDQTDMLFRGKVTTLNPNFGAGLYYYNAKNYIGFSVPYILNSSIVAVEGVVSEARRYRYYYLYGGTTMDVNNNVKFKPSALIRFQEGAPLSFDLNGTFVMYETVGVGVSYRWDDSLISMFEIKLHESLHLGYAYEYTLSEINQFSNGTHEVMINWRYKIPMVHKGIECPAYF